MTDSDADEPVKPPRRHLRETFWTADRVILLSGFALAASAAFYPWYVFFNEDKFGIKVAITSMKRDQPDFAGRGVVNAPPNGFSSLYGHLSRPAVGDELITGAIPDKARLAIDKKSSDEDQPFPAGASAFRLLHVSGDRAMIEDTNGVYIVGAGSLLPDHSKLEAIEKRGDDWVLVTDQGTEYDGSGKR